MREPLYRPTGAQDIRLGPTRARLQEIRGLLEQRSKDGPFVLFTGNDDVSVRVRIIRFITRVDSGEIGFSAQREDDHRVAVTGAWSPRDAPADFTETDGSGWIFYPPSFRDLSKIRERKNL